MRVAVALRLRPHPSGFETFTPPVDDAAGLGWLTGLDDPKIQEALLIEAFGLLSDDDRLVLASRLPGDPYEPVARALTIDIGEAGPRYAAAVERLGERLAWVVARERLGTSPPEREVLAQVRFFGRGAQEIAHLLRLPEEVVERWVALDREPRGVKG